MNFCKESIGNSGQIMKHLSVYAGYRIFIVHLMIQHLTKSNTSLGKLGAVPGVALYNHGLPQARLHRLNTVGAGGFSGR